jgi:glycosyltransferase involved in cell wall biosynthesis
VVASSLPAIPEVCAGAARLVDPSNTEALGFALRELATNENLRRNLEERGRTRAQEFSWERAAQETWAVYQELS